MKKLLLLLLFLLIPKVDALTYSDYSSFSDFTEEPISENSLVDVVTEKRYQYYKFNKELGPYLLAGTNSKYEYIDYNDYILSEPSDTLLEKPDGTNRVITSIKQYKYQKVSPINYFQINLSKDSSNVQIQDLHIYNKGQEITNYEIVGYFTNFDVQTGSGYINKNGWIHFRLREDVYLDDLKVTLNLNGDYKNVGYTIITGHNDNPYETDIIYAKKDFEYKNVSDYNETLLFKNFNLENPKYEYFYDTEREESNVLKKTNEIRYLYQYQDKLYRYYNLEKVYNDEYTKDAVGDFIYKDEENYKIYYAYRTRKIINDEILSNNLLKTKNLLEVPINTNSNKKKSIENQKDDEQENYYKADTFYEKPLETVNYGMANILDKPNTTNNNLFYIIYFLIFLILSIIILLLSKYYKNKMNCVKV